ncbi:MAG: hypothetical protein U0790_07690 [Isosphaeraceae bacterium]
MGAFGGLAFGSGGACGFGRVPVLASTTWSSRGSERFTAPVFGLTRSDWARVGEAGWPTPFCWTIWTSRPSWPFA